MSDTELDALVAGHDESDLYEYYTLREYNDRIRTTRKGPYGPTFVIIFFALLALAGVASSKHCIRDDGGPDDPRRKGGWVYAGVIVGGVGIGAVALAAWYASSVYVKLFKVRRLQSKDDTLDSETRKSFTKVDGVGVLQALSIISALAFLAAGIIPWFDGLDWPVQITRPNGDGLSSFTMKCIQEDPRKLATPVFIVTAVLSGFYFFWAVRTAVKANENKPGVRVVNPRTRNIIHHNFDKASYPLSSIATHSAGGSASRFRPSTRGPMSVLSKNRQIGFEEE